MHAKLQKLEEQKDQSDRLNAILNKEGGLIQSQAQTCKNLEAAVAVSKRPGFFEHPRPSGRPVSPDFAFKEDDASMPTLPQISSSLRVCRPP